MHTKRSRFLKLSVIFGFTLFVHVIQPTVEAQAREYNPGIDAESIKILESMDAYMGAISAFSFDVNVTDQYSDESGKIFEAKKQATLTVRRPDRLKVYVKADTPEREAAFYYNGKTVRLVDHTAKIYAQIDAPDTTEKALDFAMDELGFTFPLIDFVLDNLYQNLTQNVLTSDYLGTADLNGHKCHQLTFNQDNIDWYLWIDAGKKSVPRKFLIVYKDEPQRSKFIANISKFKALKNLSETTFNEPAPEGFDQTEFLLVPEEEEEESEKSNDTNEQE